MVGKRCFELEAKNEKAKQGLNKVDCRIIKKNFGYMVKQLRKLPKEDWESAGKAVLEHYFENHEFCGCWCKRKEMSQEQLEADRKKSGKYYRCKERDAKVYTVLKGILDPFTTIGRLEEIAHGGDTQMNESLNNTISWYAPKNKTFSGSKSLRARVYLAVGIVLVGYKEYISELLAKIGIEATSGVKQHLLRVNTRKYNNKSNRQSLEYKRKRQESNHAKIRDDIAKAEAKRRKTGFYKQGEGFNTCIPIDIVPKCKACGSEDHKTSQSNKCPMNILNKKKAAEAILNDRQKDIDNSNNIL